MKIVIADGDTAGARKVSGVDKPGQSHSSSIGHACACHKSGCDKRTNLFTAAVFCGCFMQIDSRVLHFTGVPKNIQEDQLKKAFSSFGTVLFVFLFKNRGSHSTVSVGGNESVCID